MGIITATIGALAYCEEGLEKARANADPLEISNWERYVRMAKDDVAALGIVEDSD